MLCTSYYVASGTICHLLHKVWLNKGRIVWLYFDCKGDIIPLSFESRPKSILITKWFQHWLNNLFLQPTPGGMLETLQHTSYCWMNVFPLCLWLMNTDHIAQHMHQVIWPSSMSLSLGCCSSRVMVAPAFDWSRAEHKPSTLLIQKSLWMTDTLHNAMWWAWYGTTIELRHKPDVLWRPPLANRLQIRQTSPAYGGNAR